MNAAGSRPRIALDVRLMRRAVARVLMLCAVAIAVLLLTGLASQQPTRMSSTYAATGQHGAPKSGPRPAMPSIREDWSADESARGTPPDRSH